MGAEIPFDLVLLLIVLLLDADLEVLDADSHGLIQARQPCRGNLLLQVGHFRRRLGRTLLRGKFGEQFWVVPRRWLRSFMVDGLGACHDLV